MKTYKNDPVHIKEIQKIFDANDWADYMLITNMPNRRCCEVWYVGRDPQTLPYPTQKFDNNKDLLNYILNNILNYHPSQKITQKNGKIDDGTQGFFDKREMIRQEKKSAVKQLEDRYKAFEAWADIYGIKMPREIQNQIDKFKKQAKNL